MLADVSITIISLGHDGLYTEVNATIIRPPSWQCPYICKHNYHTVTVRKAYMQM
jgi:hypothetical protein